MVNTTKLIGSEGEVNELGLVVNEGKPGAGIDLDCRGLKEMGGGMRMGEECETGR